MSGDRTQGGVTGDGDLALRRTARGGALNLVGSGLSAVAQLGAVLVVTRGIGQESAGGLFAGVSVLLIGAAVAQLGTDVSLVRHVSACQALGRRRDAVRVVREASAGVLVAGILVVVATAALPRDRVSELLGGSDPLTTLVLTLGIPLLALHELCLAVTRGVGTMRPTVVLERVVRPLLQVAMLGVAVVVWGTPIALAAAWVAPWAFVLPLSAAAAHRALRPLTDEGPTQTTTSRAAFWRFSATRAVSRACQVALQRLDIILVAAIAGASAAAVYMAATRFLVLGQLVATAVQQAAQPFFAGLHSTGDVGSLQQLLRRTTVWMVALVWPAYVVMALCGAPLLLLFGEGYDRGAASLAVLAVAMLAATAAGPVDVVLLMAGRGGTSLAITVLALVVDVLLCLLLIPRVGLLGAALAWAVAIVVRNVATVWTVSHSPGVRAGSPLLTRVAVQVLLVVGVPTALAVALGSPPPVLAAVVIASGLGYLALLWRDRDRYDLGLVLGSR